MPLIGFLIVQNGFPDILRALDSLTCCDEIYICDGGSTDGSREWLESVKDIYHLRLFDRLFDNMQNQRNFLLEQIPNNSWIINIDQDEQLSPITTYYLKEVIKTIPPEHYASSTQEERVLTFDIPYLILINDYEHYCFPYTYLRGKTFFYKEGIKFYHPYHSEPSYSSELMSQYLALTVPDRFAIFHYAFFNPKRHEQRKERLEKLMENEKENNVEWEYKQWFETKRDVRPVPEKFLAAY